MKRKSGARLWALAVTVLLLELLVFQENPARAQSWTQLAPTGGPPGVRMGHSAVLDPTTNQMIVFGGDNGAFLHLNDLWGLSNANGLGTPQWTQITPSGTAPSPRWVHKAAYDLANNRMIVFGGSIGFNAPCSDQVFVLTNANGMTGTPTWTQLSPSGSIPARFQHSTAYDAANNRLIVHGGSNCFGLFTDTWVLTNANGLGGIPTWTQLAPSGTPPLGGANASAYDPATNQLIVFDTNSNVFVLSNANGTGGTPAWTQLSPSGTGPTTRSIKQAGYDRANNRLILFGGGFDEVWVLRNANGVGGTPSWTQLSITGASPGPRGDNSAVYDEANNRLTVFGGNVGGTVFNDAWVLTNANGNVPFAVFNPKVEIELGPLANDDEFEVKAALTLGTSSDGIAPLTEAVTIQVGSFSATIPAGSFKLKPAKPNKPAFFKFEGIINGVAMEAKITPLGADSFEFKAEGNGVNLTGTANPVTVTLIIGNDQGSATVAAEFE